LPPLDDEPVAGTAAAERRETKRHRLLELVEEERKDALARG
jgi:hypothetical protein